LTLDYLKHALAIVSEEISPSVLARGDFIESAEDFVLEIFSEATAFAPFLDLLVREKFRARIHEGRVVQTRCGHEQVKRLGAVFERGR
jgi:hypothetical protein